MICPFKYTKINRKFINHSFSAFLLLFLLSGGFISLYGETKYTVKPAGTFADKRDPHYIRLKAVQFDVRTGSPSFEPQELDKTDNPSGREKVYLIVHFTGTVRESWKKEIRGMGGKFFGYIPNHAFRVRVPKDRVDELSSLQFVDWVGELKPAFRIHPDLLEPQKAEVRDYMGNPQQLDKPGTITLIIEVFEDENMQAVQNRIAQLDCEFLGVSGNSISPGYFKIRIPEGNSSEIVKAVSRMPEIAWVERYYTKTIFNSWSCWITQSYNTSGMGNAASGWYRIATVDATHAPIFNHGLYGNGQIVGAGDTGIDWDGRYFCETSGTINLNGSGSTFSGTPGTKIQGYQTLGDDHDGASKNCTALSRGSSGHGTHVAGTIAGDSTHHHYDYAQAHGGVGSPVIARGDGAAPLAKIAFQDISTTPGCGTNDALNGIPLNLYTDYFPWAYNAGARIHSNSWGSTLSDYSTDAQNCDRFMWNNKDFLIFFAMGNAGPSQNTIGEPATGKSMVSVGMSQSGGGCSAPAYCDQSTIWQNPGDPIDRYGYNAGDWNPDGIPDDELETVNWSSSHGPTDEGLMKPEVCVPGGHQIFSAWSDGDETSGNPGTGATTCNSATSNGTYLCQMGGTSMACPHAAGSCALIRQYYVDGWYLSGTKTPANTLTPSAALMKATLINSTRNMTGYYTSDNGSRTVHADVPTNGQGWGRVALDDALYFDTDTRKLIVQDVSPGLSDGEADTFEFTTGSSTTEQVKAVLCWTDYWGLQGASDPLVNDLNLTVKVGANTYRGNVFSGGLSQTGGSYDVTNATEVVWLNPSPNTAYMVIIDGADINQAPQPYGLVITGETYENTPPEIPELTNVLFDNERQNDQTPTIEWKVPSDLEGEDLHFRFQWDDDSDFDTPLGDVETSGDPGFTGGPFPVTEGTGATISYTFQSNLTDGNTYWWRVCAYDGTSYGSWSAPRSFTVNTTQSEPDWFQTTGDQWSTDILSSVAVVGDAVELTNITGYSEELYWDDGGGGTYIFNDPYYFSCLFKPAKACTIKTAKFSVGVNGVTTASCTLFVWEYTGSDIAPGAVVYGPVAFRPTATGWYSINLPTPYYDSDGQFWIGAYFPNQQNTSRQLFLYAENNTPINEKTYYSANRTGPWTLDTGYDDYIRTIVKYPDEIATSGTATSTPIDYNDNTGFPSSWNEAVWTETEPPGGNTVKLQVEYCNSGSWALVPNILISNNSTGIQTSPIDLTALSTTTYDSIRLKATLEKTTTTPQLEDWAVSWVFGPPAPHLVHQSHTIDDNAGGDNDGFPEPGESVVMPVTLLNNGGASATNVSATLSTSDGYITVTDNYATFPNIAQSASQQSNANHYAFDIDPMTPCPHTVSFTITWTSDENNGIDIFNVDLCDPGNTLPDAPELVFPFPYARLGAGGNSVTPTLTWNIPSDVDGDLLHFRVQWDTDSAFGSPDASIESRASATGFSCSPPVSEGSGTCSYTVNSQSEGTLSNGNTYWWRVSAWDANGYGGWSAIRSFTVNTSLSEIDWHQTTDEQLGKCVMRGGVSISGDEFTGIAALTQADQVNTPVIEPSFESTTGWTYTETGDADYSHQQSSSYVTHGNQNHELVGTANLSQNSYCRYSQNFDMTCFSIMYTDLYTLAGNNNNNVSAIIRINNTNVWEEIIRNDLEGAETDVTIDISSFTGSNDLHFEMYANSNHFGNQREYYIDNIRLGRAIVSEAIHFSWATGGINWDKLEWGESGANGDFRVTVQQFTGGSWQNIGGLTDLDYNVAGHDISFLDTEDSIRLVGEFTYSPGSPTVTDWTVTWSYSAVGVELLIGNESGGDYGTWALGQIAPGTVKIMNDGDRVYVKNSGSVAIDVSIQASAIAWAYSNAAGADQCVLMGLFNGDTPPNPGDFSTTYDLVGTDMRAAGTPPDGKFAGSDNDGVDITIGSGEELYFYFQAPNPNTVSAQQDITITIQAVAH
ncbi:S8 family serine peptidase [bacterium]|nr:S8 family serine peptidase [bacterium]